MRPFWNCLTKALLICTFVFPICNFCINYIYNVEGWGIANSITLFAVFITILSTFYSNYKGDERANEQIKTSEEQFKKQLEQNEKNLREQLLFDKKQEIYIKLYKDLDTHWELLDTEKVEYYINNYPNYQLSIIYLMKHSQTSTEL